MILDEISGHTVYLPAIGRGAVVLDLGANTGRFSLEMIARYGARCYAVEPNPFAHRQIPIHAMLTLFPFAIDEKSGVRQFYAASNSESSSFVRSSRQSEPITLHTSTMSLAEFLSEQRIEHVDVLKLDIEGAEIGVIATCPDEVLQRVVQITVEFHDFNGLTPVADVNAALDRLRSLGFFVLRMSRSSYIDVLLINPRLCGLTFFQRIWMTLFVRNWRGLQRMVSRRISAARGIRGQFAGDASGEPVRRRRVAAAKDVR